MTYHLLDYRQTVRFCEKVFEGYGFSAQESRDITDVLLAADLSGIESHGIQRLVRYDYEIGAGMVKMDAQLDVLRETPVSATVDAHDMMGQLAGKRAMRMAINKAKKSGIGLVTMRNSNHFGIAGYYANMACDEGLMGLCMTNSEAIMVPTFGKQPMLGTNPIALALPADPTPYLFDGATTVVPRGKLEVYVKRGDSVPEGWVLDENGRDTSDPARVLKNIIAKTGGGILPLGGSGDKTSGYKGYGFGMICEIFTSILSQGATSDMIYKQKGRSEICQFFGAIDPAIFGDPAAIRAHFSAYLEKIRLSDKAEGQTRIYIQGEKEYESRMAKRVNGLPVNDKTIEEMKKIAQAVGATAQFPEEIKRPEHDA